LKTQALDEPGLNLTPMIDVVFLLIIFFIVGTEFRDMERQYEVQLPTVTDAQPLTELPDPLTVSILRDGNMTLGADRKSLEQLERDLRQARENYAEQAVVIRADGEGKYQFVMNVLEVCQRAKIKNVSLPARLKEE